jgi:transposase
MDYRNEIDPTAASEHVTIAVAIELSDVRWLVGVQRDASGGVSIHTVASGDVEEVARLIERERLRLARQGRRATVVTCYEAGRDGFWPHRALEGLGYRNHVIDPASIAVPRRQRRAKTDRIDVRGLVAVLRAWLGGDRLRCRMVRVPSAAEEDARRPHRERERLIRERVMHVNRIKGLCALHGIKGVEPVRCDRRAQLAGVRTAAGTPLPAEAAAELARELERLELVLRQLGELEQARDAALRAPAPEAAGAVKAQQLMRLRSVGAATASVLGGEVFYRRFANRRQVASFVGLTPTPFASGKSSREQGIAKAGNRRARAMMLELAWLWLRYQPDSALSRWFVARVGGAKGRLKRIAIVALARKLLVALWRYLETGVVPTGALMKR